jgi:hypothetical protein
MKKITLSVCAVAIVAFAGVNVRMNMSRENGKSSDLVLRNIKALGQSEGTPASSCARRVAPNAGTLEYRIFCDSRTDANTIYPCSTSSSWDYYAASNSDRCTK